jgi:hypothetical protein
MMNNAGAILICIFLVPIAYLMGMAHQSIREFNSALDKAQEYENDEDRRLGINRLIRENIEAYKREQKFLRIAKKELADELWDARCGVKTHE